jgi:putative transposase
MRQAWIDYQTLPDISKLTEETQSLDCFKNLHNTKTAKQTIRKCLTDWTNFKKALNAYKKDSSKFLGRPKPPGYKKKLAQVVFYNETIKGGQSGKIEKQQSGMIIPTNDCFSIKSDRVYKQVVITPKTFGFIIDVSYETQSAPRKKKQKSVACIDLGVNNLCAITSDKHSPILINGRIVKSINQYYNANPCKTRSKKRYFRMENYFHHVSKFLIDNCVNNKIGTIIIGKNDGWKQNTKKGKRMRKKNRQEFQYIPFGKLIEKIVYKAELVGVDVVFTEEAYTSQSSFLDRDILPDYETGKKTNLEFSGKRIKRGLYQSKEGILLNADCNGSANIGRKIFPNMNNEWDRSVAATPVIVNPLRSKKLSVCV